MIYRSIKHIKQFLTKPFLMWEYTIPRKFFVIFLFISTSVAFIHIFEPTVFSILPEQDRIMHFVSHSLVAITAFLIFYFVVPLGFRGYFKEQNRTIGRQLIFIIGLTVTASEGNRIIALVLKEATNFTFISSLGFTLGISLFPFFIWLMLSVYRMTTENPANRLIRLSANIGNDSIKVFLKDLLFIKALSNYSEVYFIDDGEVKMRMLRVPLSTLETQLDSEYCVRCHRSYIINLFNLIKIEGNVNGSKIHLRGHEQIIPVSKSRREEVMGRLKVLPISHISELLLDQAAANCKDEFIIT